MENSIHYKQRLSQRCIPPVVDLWLNRFGKEEFDGHGGVRVYFNHQSVKKMEREFGRHFVRENAKYLNAYKVESSRDGCAITSGWLTKRIWRK